jgi:DNA-binding PadR family transcriptional regulator
VRLATGALYTALDRLAADGYVQMAGEEIVNGRARRSYALTQDGAAALRAEAARMAPPGSSWAGFSFWQGVASSAVPSGPEGNAEAGQEAQL